eukprot:SM000002S05615  [mRNA]  locus=s2:1270435:1272567:+ [translate_table: standard]
MTSARENDSGTPRTSAYLGLLGSHSQECRVIKLQKRGGLMNPNERHMRAALPVFPAAASAAEPAAPAAADLGPADEREDVADGTPLRAEALHLHASPHLRTADVLGYFTGFSPVAVEWVSPSSCNVAFGDPFSAKRALLRKGTLEPMADPDSAAPWHEGKPLVLHDWTFPISLRVASILDAPPNPPVPGKDGLAALGGSLGDGVADKLALGKRPRGLPTGSPWRQPAHRDLDGEVALNLDMRSILLRDQGKVFSRLGAKLPPTPNEVEQGVDTGTARKLQRVDVPDLRAYLKAKVAEDGHIPPVVVKGRGTATYKRGTFMPRGSPEAANQAQALYEPADKVENGEVEVEESAVSPEALMSPSSKVNIEAVERWEPEEATPSLSARRPRVRDRLGGTSRGEVLSTGAGDRVRRVKDRLGAKMMVRAVEEVGTGTGTCRRRHRGGKRERKKKDRL